MVEKGFIYIIKNKINDKQYVGCTIHPLKKRFEEHFWRCSKSDSNSKICNSIRKYGIENFKIELLEECDISNIYEREKYYINEYKTYDNGLNSTYGGEGCLGYTHSKEIRKKISDIIKDGRSHKGKTYEEIYGEKVDEEKEKRRKSVKKSWDGMTEEKKQQRIEKTKESVRKKSKYSEEVIKDIRKKLNENMKVKDIIKIYPYFNPSYIYTIKSNKRWKNV
jgi:group I intron endonuclease